MSIYLLPRRHERKAYLDFPAINRRALLSLDYILRQWLPDGKLQNTEWVARNPLRDDKHVGSFKVNIRTGRWADFASDAKGGDVISLASYLTGSNYYEAARGVAQMLGMEGEAVR